MYPFPPSKSWHMPDGTKTSNRPKDGQVYREWDSQGNEKATWQWDDVKEQWFNVSSGKPTKHNTATYPISNPGYFAGMDLDNMVWEGGPQAPTKEPVVKCDCGSEHVGSPRHSSWCSKYAPGQ